MAYRKKAYRVRSRRTGLRPRARSLRPLRRRRYY